MKINLNIRSVPLMLTLLIALTVSSCGYGVRPTPMLDSVSITALDNRTHEPALQDELRLELTRELLARGVEVINNSGNEITGTLESLTIKPLAERAGIAVKFSVTITGRFDLKREGSSTREIKTPLKYIIAFGSDVPLDDLYALRELAVKRAINFLAADIAAGAAYIR